jgi:hypothetical protein
VFTPEGRRRLRDRLLAAARADERISGAAITGSGAAGIEDAWSDIDLAFGVSNTAQMTDVLRDWTESMYRDHGALHDFDVVAGTWVYRVFLLEDTLQVDLAFAPELDFGARAPTFRLLFGAAADLPDAAPPVAANLIGMGWLYALHARSCTERGELWRAEFMISGVRDQVLALACMRHGLPTSQGRGLDRLPATVTRPLEQALVQTLEAGELWRAFAVAMDGLVGETRLADPALADRIEPALRELAKPRPPSAGHE